MVWCAVVEICFGFHHVGAALAVADHGEWAVDLCDDAIDLFGVVLEWFDGAGVGSDGRNMPGESESFEDGFEFVTGDAVGDDAHGGDEREIDETGGCGGHEPDDGIAAEGCFVVVESVNKIDDGAVGLCAGEVCYRCEGAMVCRFVSIGEPSSDFVVVVLEVVVDRGDAQCVGGASP